MKTTLVEVLLACTLLSGALAQGQITFSATTGNLIRYSPDGTLASAVPIAPGNPAQLPVYGNVNVALYGAPLGTPLTLKYGIPDLSGPWKIQTSPVLQQIGPVAGGMTDKIVLMNPSVLDASGNLQLTVVAWTGPATDFLSAVTTAGPVLLLAWTGDRFSGGALSWASGSGSATTPYGITKGPNAYNGLLLVPFPEPSTFSLAGLGGAALLILRRRR